MEDPTVTQSVRTMMERRGTTLVALALLRHLNADNLT
jgi:hypothetical protein